MDGRGGGVEYGPSFHVIATALPICSYVSTADEFVESAHAGKTKRYLYHTTLLNFLLEPREGAQTPKG